MTQDITRCLIRILLLNKNKEFETVGTGFLLSKRLAVTCAHVVKRAGRGPSKHIWIEYYHTEQRELASVLRRGWAPDEVKDHNQENVSLDDVAFIALRNSPIQVSPVILGKSEGSVGHRYRSFGFAKVSGYSAQWVADRIGGPVRHSSKLPMLQCRGELIRQRMSGAPILDVDTNRVVGMVSEVNAHGVAWATTTETLQQLHGNLRLWPGTYGPTEVKAYLEYMLSSHDTFTLLDGTHAPLEKLYVSLRASQMRTSEWEGKSRFYEREITRAQKTLGLAADSSVDPYQLQTIMARILTFFPKPHKVDTQDLKEQFLGQSGVRNTLAEVVKRHRHFVILGEPGAGKTTLGRWLILQHARALLNGKKRVIVRADQVQAGSGGNDLQDLGEALVPLLVRISAYESMRWSVEFGDSNTSLFRFLGQDFPAESLAQFGLTPSVVYDMIQDHLHMGKVLIILDGLDEIADIERRKTVMAAVNDFILGRESMPQLGSMISTRLADRATNQNKIVVTSQIVGYQIQALSSLPHYYVVDMEPTAIKAFCFAWISFKIVDSVKAHEWATQLYDQIAEHAHEGIRVLAGNPFLLTILALVYWDRPEKTLPSMRADLFHSAVHAFYKQRERHWVQHRISEEDFTLAMARVADFIHTNRPTGYAEAGMVAHKLQEGLTHKQVSELLTAAKVSGFLVARGEDVFGFLHRSFQEYFCAVHLARKHEEVVNTVLPILFSPHWREPIMLVAGIISMPIYPFSALTLSYLIQAILDAEDSISETLPRRELLAAAACAECVRIPTELLPALTRLVRDLVSFNSVMEGYNSNSLLRLKIIEAIQTMRSSAASASVEIALCKLICSESKSERANVLLMINQADWYTQAIRLSLEEAWKKYAGPAILLLHAISKTSKITTAAPTEEIELIRRRFGSKYGDSYMQVEGSAWTDILCALFMPGRSVFEPERIFLPSPWSQEILKQLEIPRSKRLDSKTLDSKKLANLERLATVAAQDSTSGMGRDSALILGIAGNIRWIEGIVSGSSLESRSKLHSIFATYCLHLGFLLSRLEKTTSGVRLLFEKAESYLDDIMLNLVRDDQMEADFNVKRIKGDKQISDQIRSFDGWPLSAEEIVDRAVGIRSELDAMLAFMRPFLRPEDAHSLTVSYPLSYEDAVFIESHISNAIQISNEWSGALSAVIRSRTVLTRVGKLIQQLQQEFWMGNKINSILDKIVLSLKQLDGYCHRASLLVRVSDKLQQTLLSESNSLSPKTPQHTQKSVTLPSSQTASSLFRDTITDLLSEEDHRRDRARAGCVVGGVSLKISLSYVRY